MKPKIHNRHRPPYCGECPYFLYEGLDGFGICDIQKQTANCSFVCDFTDRPPTPKETERLLHHYQKYRRGTKPKAPSPFLIGVAIDEAIRIIRKLRRRNKL